MLDIGNERNLGGYIRIVTYEHLTNVLHYIRQRQDMNSYLQLPESSASLPSKYKLVFERSMVGWIVLSVGLVLVYILEAL